MNRKPMMNNTLRFLGLVFFQVLILNNVRLGGYINPFLYILFIIKIPSNVPKWGVLCLSFALGFSVDIFSTTMGFHAFSATFAGLCRIQLFDMFFSKHDRETTFTPGLQMGNFGTFALYSFVIILAHSLCYFFIEIFILEEIFEVIMRAILSAIVTAALALFVEFLFKFTKGG